VTSSDGRASIVIPPGALSSETVITVDPAAAYPPAQLPSCSWGPTTSARRGRSSPCQRR
jgi:hypothetical protein